MDRTNTEVQSCKVVLLGESGVGKTSIISRYINNNFQSNFMPTLGACFAAKSLEIREYNKQVKFEVVFVKIDARIAILVYDITNKDSFEAIKNYWYHQIKDFSPKNIIIAIAANKSDLMEFETVNEQEGRDFAKSINAIYRLTSAKNASGVDDLFFSLGLKVIDPNFNENSNNAEESMLDFRVNERLKLKGNQSKSATKKKGCC